MQVGGDEKVVMEEVEQFGMRIGLSEDERTPWIRAPLSGKTMPIVYRCHFQKDESAFHSENSNLI